MVIFFFQSLNTGPFQPARNDGTSGQLHERIRQREGHEPSQTVGTQPSPVSLLLVVC